MKGKHFVRAALDLAKAPGEFIGNANRNVHQAARSMYDKRCKTTHYHISRAAENNRPKPESRGPYPDRVGDRSRSGREVGGRLFGSILTPRLGQPVARMSDMRDCQPPHPDVASLIRATCRGFAPRFKQRLAAALMNSGGELVLAARDHPGWMNGLQPRIDHAHHPDRKFGGSDSEVACVRCMPARDLVPMSPHSAMVPVRRQPGPPAVVAPRCPGYRRKS